MKTWQQILIEADAFVKFLSQDSLCAKPYNGGLPEEFVLTDATIARLVASGGLPEGFEDWESLTDSVELLNEKILLLTSSLLRGDYLSFYHRSGKTNLYSLS